MGIGNRVRVAIIASVLIGSHFRSERVTGQDLFPPPPPVVNEASWEQRLNALEARVNEQQATIDFQQQQLQLGQTPVESAMPSPVAKERPRTTIGGQYRLMYNSNNFGFHPLSLSDRQSGNTSFNQRFRTWLTVHGSEHVRGYLQAEMGHIFWGEDFDFPKTYAVAPGDRIGVEMRFGYLEYETDDIGLLRAGIQGWDDRFNEMLASSTWDFSVGGLLWRKKTLTGCDLSAGIFELAENNVSFADDAFLLVLDADLIAEETHSFGLSAYYLPDRGGYSYPTIANYDTAWDAWLGIRGSVNLGRGKLNSFAIYNSGARSSPGDPTYRHDGAALRLELAGVQFGPGKWSVQTVYSTGNHNPNGSYSHEFRTIAQSARDNFGAQSYWSYLITSSPHGPSDLNDLGVSLQNRGLGLFTVQAKYEYPLTERIVGNSAVGWLSSDANNPVSQSKAMGTEIAQMLTYDFGGGLKTDLGAAVFFTGDFYRASPLAPPPDNLYEAFTRVQLEF